MKKNILFIFLFFLIFSNAMATSTNNTAKNNNGQQTVAFDRKKAEELKIFLDDIYKERLRDKRESDLAIKQMHAILDDIRLLVQDSRKEITQFTYRENRNLLIGTIFLWCSITMFIIMNIVFANSLKKELYFLRNVLLKDEIKDSINNLTEQLKKMNERLNKNKQR